MSDGVANFLELVVLLVGGGLLGSFSYDIQMWIQKKKRPELRSWLLAFWGAAIILGVFLSR